MNKNKKYIIIDIQTLVSLCFNHFIHHIKINYRNNPKKKK